MLRIEGWNWQDATPPAYTSSRRNAMVEGWNFHTQTYGLPNEVETVILTTEGTDGKVTMTAVPYMGDDITGVASEETDGTSNPPDSDVEKRYNMREVYESKSGAYKVTKRIMDCVLSLLALVALSPVFLITAICIKLEDGGPVFFVQPRAGKDGKPFKLIKFRSMCVGADAQLKDLLARNEQTGHAFKIKDDPRITKVGKVIRKCCIDELPQLINIIKGDMSIVGPRPILVWQMDECNEYEKQRLIVRPGLTCYWQISGRSNIKWEQWVEMDLDYIEDMSLWTDFKLIVKTIPAIFSLEGAY